MPSKCVCTDICVLHMHMMTFYAACVWDFNFVFPPKDFTIYILNSHIHKSNSIVTGYVYCLPFRALSNSNRWNESKNIQGTGRGRTAVPEELSARFPDCVTSPRSLLKVLCCLLRNSWVCQNLQMCTPTVSGYAHRVDRRLQDESTMTSSEKEHCATWIKNQRWHFISHKPQMQISGPIGELFERDSCSP